VQPIDLSTPASINPPQPSFGQRLRNAWDALTGRPFGPGQPVEPSLPKDAERTPGPRQFEYPPLVNIQRMPRREQPGLLTPFDQLRNLASLYDVAAMCIAARIEELQGMGWSVVPKDKKRKDLQDECDLATAFFQSPDKHEDFPSWLGMILYELYTTDALTLFRRPDMGGRLYSLEPVDGSTIKPLLDERGRIGGYQQIIHGIVETQFNRQELIYKPRWVRTFTPYGFPPTEWIILRVNQALRKQTFDLAWFTDGNIPEMVATPPEGSLDPKQTEEFETWFNAVLEGQDKARRKVRFIPWKMNFEILKQFSYETALDEWMLRVTCAAYSVPPQELGFTYDVNRATAEMQEAVNERRGVKPLATWIKNVILDKNIHQLDRSRSDKSVSRPGAPTKPAVSPFSLIEWQWQFGDKTDELTLAQVHGTDIQNGVITPDESRVIRYGDTLDGPAPGLPAQPFPFGTTPEFSNPSPVSAASWKAAARARQVRKAAVLNNQHTGAMIAFLLPPDAAGKLTIAPAALRNGEVIPSDELHITLAFLGETAGVDADKATLLAALDSFAVENKPLAGIVSGFGRFKGEDGKDAIYASFDSPELPEFRQRLLSVIGQAGAQVERNHGFTPHITLAYIPSSEPTPDLELPELQIEFDAIALAWEEAVHLLPLGAGSQTAKVAAASGVAADRFFQGAL
jgi:2'-5' RNA ligase